MISVSQAFDQAVKFHQSGQFAQADQLYRQVLQADPNHINALHLFGVLACQGGRPDVGVDLMQKAVRLKPDFAEAHGNLGNAFYQMGRWPEGIASYRQAVHYKPDFAEAHLGLARTLMAQGDNKEAAVHLRETVRLRPTFAEAYFHLGNLLREENVLDEAIDNLRQAVRYAPNHAAAHGSLGVALCERNDLAEAMTCFVEALRLQPNLAEAHLGVASVLREQGKMDEAIARTQEALRHKPDYAEAHMSLGMKWLVLGDFDKGWPEFEWRLRRPETALPPMQQPCWDGSPMPGKTLLVLAEQGRGDLLQFARYIPLAQERVGRVLLACDATLLPLMGWCAGAPPLLATGSALPEFDMYVPIMSLPRLLGTTDPQHIPAKGPYLASDPALVKQWRVRLDAHGPGPRIGIAWQGNPKYKGDRRRSIPLRHIQPLTQVPGVKLFSLQKGFGVDQLSQLAGQIIDLGSTLDETAGAFMDTAAVMKNLDLVVTSDTSIAHLAGALGVPVWVALPFQPDWRWLLKREDCPWYPTMRLFRQTAPGNWAEVFARITAELAKKYPPAKDARQARIVRPIHVDIAAGELIDRITILQIKKKRITDAGKQAHVRDELAALEAVHSAAVPASAKLSELTTALQKINETLWQVEDDIRLCESKADFGKRFVDLARSVYQNNDRRAALKRQINDLLGSSIVEEKQFGKKQ